jgi:hypothetical protein
MEYVERSFHEWTTACQLLAFEKGPTVSVFGSFYIRRICLIKAAVHRTGNTKLIMDHLLHLSSVKATNEMIARSSIYTFTHMISHSLTLSHGFNPTTVQQSTVIKQSYIQEKKNCISFSPKYI